jgi:hypothetical protein
MQSCHLLDLEVVNGKIKAPTPYYDPSLEALKIKGQEFEDNVIKEMEEQGKSIVRISKDFKKPPLKKPSAP